MKPKLNDHYKVCRMEYCLVHEDPQCPRFFNKCLDRVHIDENWFYITPINRRFILAPGEQRPY